MKNPLTVEQAQIELMKNGTLPMPIVTERKNINIELPQIEKTPQSEIDILKKLDILDLEEEKLIYQAKPTDETLKLIGKIRYCIFSLIEQLEPDTPQAKELRKIVKRL